MSAIEVKNLTKKFNGFTAIDHISFDVKEGELFGLLGPNGAGKTTTLNILSTLLKPTSGKADIVGFDIVENKDDVRKSIGIVFQDPALDAELTGRENLEFHAMMYGMNKESRKKRIKDVINLVELSDKADILVSKYSGGMKRRLEIARGLMHRPKVLFLDEPTLGLDAQTRRKIWEYIKKLNKESNVTIILTTHYMEEADYLCERVAIVDNGKIVAMDTPSKLKNSLGGDVVSLEVGQKSDQLMKILEECKWIKKMKKHDGTLSLTMEDGEKRIPELVKTSEKHGIEILSVNFRKPSLEDVFIHFTGKSIRDHEASREDVNKQIMKRRMGMRH
ncbi:MAG: ATP-binding cassette domain-containing protein [Nanoarchaeota archaeon]